MNRESFLEGITRQLAEEIQAAYLECEHEDGRVVDIPELNKKLEKMMKLAKLEGLKPAEFVELVRSTLPEVADKLPIAASESKAA